MAAVFGGPFFAMLGNMRDQVVRSVLGSDGGENQLSVGIFPDPVTGKPRDLPLLPAAVMALCLLAGLLLAAARGRKRWLPARGSVAQRAARAAALAFFVSALSETVKRSSLPPLPLYRQRRWFWKTDLVWCFGTSCFVNSTRNGVSRLVLRRLSDPPAWRNEPTSPGHAAPRPPQPQIMFVARHAGPRQAAPGPPRP